MHASLRRRAGALALAVLALLGVMTAFAPGRAAAASGCPTGDARYVYQWPGDNTYSFSQPGVGSFDWENPDFTWDFEPGLVWELCAEFEGAGEDVITNKTVEWPSSGTAQFPDPLLVTLRVGLDYPVIPVKVWSGAEGEGFGATITISYGDGTSSRTWTVDAEGVSDDAEPFVVPYTVDVDELTWIEEVTVPQVEGGEWSCSSEGGFSPADLGYVLAVTNTCSFQADQQSGPSQPVGSGTPPRQDEAPAPAGEEPEVVAEPVPLPGEAPAGVDAAGAGVLPRTGPGSLAVALGGLVSVAGGLLLALASRRRA
jgi:hypothetical protein